MITIAGGTGNVGSKLVQRLRATKTEVRILTRNPEAARAALDDQSVKVVGISFDNPRSLAAAFEGSDAAFLSTGTSADQVAVETALIDAAVQAGVPYLVNLSVGGAGEVTGDNVLGWHHDIDAYLATKDLAHVAIRPATYAYTVVALSAPFIHAGAWGGVTGDSRAAFIDTRDVADVAARLLLDGPDAHDGKIYDISGPEAITMNDIASYISDAVGSQVEYHQRTEEEQRAVLASAGLPQLFVDVLIGLDDLTRSGLFAAPSSTTFELTGQAPRSIRAWVAENIDLFKTPVASAAS